jgi:SNF2 family DNA or RNA helicase
MDVMTMDNVSITPCGHLFHYECACMAATQKKCPTCRQPLSADQITMVSTMFRGAQDEDADKAAFGSKIVAIRNTIRKIHAESEDQTIIFIQFGGIMNEMNKALTKAGVRAYVLEGNVDRRKKILEAFAKTPRSVLLLSLESSPSGMNLVSANHCLLVHPMFTDNPAQAIAYERQAIGRICRQGQLKPCHIYRFVTKQTIEEELARKHHPDLMDEAISADQ